MPRDIDQIIERLKTDIAGVQISQLKVAHPGVDDDGVWFIKVPGKAGEVQIESPNGLCPFHIEADFTTERSQGHNINEVVSIIRQIFAQKR